MFLPTLIQIIYHTDECSGDGKKGDLISTVMGEYTKRLLLNLDAWCGKQLNNQINFHLNQILLGHGCFGKYLQTIKFTKRCGTYIVTATNMVNRMEDSRAMTWNSSKSAIVKGSTPHSDITEMAIFCKIVMKKEEAEYER